MVLHRELCIEHIQGLLSHFGEKLCFCWEVVMASGYRAGIRDCSCSAFPSALHICLELVVNC